MKLSSEKLDSVLEQIDAEVIPDNHPSLPKLRAVFGDHTFFVDDGGLTIIQALGEHPQTGGLTDVLLSPSGCRDVMTIVMMSALGH